MNTLKKCDDRTVWDDYICENGGHPLQLWGWGDAKSKHNWSADRLFLVDDNDQPIAAAQVLIRKLPWPLYSISYIPRGPVVGDSHQDELLDLLAKYAADNHHSVALSIEPDCIEYTVPRGWIKSKNRILPAETIILDLTKTPEQLQQVMDPNTRRYIRKAAADGLVMKPVKTLEGIKDIMSVYESTAERANFNLHDYQYYYDVFTDLQDNTAVFAAYSDDKPVAFLWLALTTDNSFELYGGMNDLGKQLHASYALKWLTISKSREWGMKRYDFGGLIGGGVNSFKKSWTDADTQLAGTFDCPLSPLYWLYSVGMPMGKKLLRKIKSLLHR